MRPVKPLLVLSVLLLALAFAAANVPQDGITITGADEVMTTTTTGDLELLDAAVVSPRFFLRYVERIWPIGLIAPPMIPNPLDRILLRYVEHSREEALGEPPIVPNPLDRIILRYIEDGRKIPLRFPVGLVASSPSSKVYLPLILASW